MNNKQKILLFTYWALILLGLLFLSCRCSTSKRAKPCKSCPQFSYIYYDTTIITIPHHNYNGMCFPEFKTLVIEEEEILIDKL
tara:strand:+ start:286 stop:534 length:249 start_codon:yes stop_codon:yes gene_type:complete